MRSFFSMFVALLILTPHAMVSAQEAEPTPEQLKLARSLYYDGLELIDKGEWAQAADRLLRVIEIRDSVVASFHLANALCHLKRYVDARLLLQKILNTPKATPEIRAAAAELLPSAEREIARLTVKLTGDLEGVRILVDGRETPAAALDVPVAVDPHEVSVVAMRDGTQVAQASALVGGDAGRDVQIVLDVPAKEESAAQEALGPGAAPVLAPNLAVVSEPASKSTSPQALEPAGEATRDDRGSSALIGKWWFWTAVGAVTAGVVITTLALSSGGSQPADASRVHGTFDPGVLEGKVQ